MQKTLLRKNPPLANVKPLTQEEADFVAKHYKEALAAANLLYQKHNQFLESFDEACEYMHEALMHAIKTFDPTKGKSFKYWAFWYANAYICRDRTRAGRHKFVERVYINEDGQEKDFLANLPYDGPDQNEIIEDKIFVRLTENIKEYIEKYISKKNYSEIKRQVVFERIFAQDDTVKQADVAKRTNTIRQNITAHERNIRKKFKTLLSRRKHFLENPQIPEFKARFKKCKTCKTKFIQVHAGQIFCSDICKYGETQCTCGKTILNNKNKTRTSCSSECSVQNKKRKGSVRQKNNPSLLSLEKTYGNGKSEAELRKISEKYKENLISLIKKEKMLNRFVDIWTIRLEMEIPNKTHEQIAKMHNTTADCIQQQELKIRKKILKELVPLWQKGS